MKVWFPHHISWAEVAVQAVLVVILTSVTYSIAVYSAAVDYNILNTYVESKDIHKFSCPTNTSNPCTNSYTCNCRRVSYMCTKTVNGKSTMSTCYRTECDTCYRYPWEQNFWVRTPLDNFMISRVDAQGATIPPRYESVNKNDAVAIVREYQNWLLASDRSLHTNDALQPEHVKHIPPYPISIYDYYNVHRIVLVNGATIPNPKVWNRELSKILTVLGPQAEANVVIVISKEMQDNFPHSVRRVWKGFKKNDIILFINVSATNTVDWVRVMSWAKTDFFNVSLRDDVVELIMDQPIDESKLRGIMNAISINTIHHFERKPMKDYEYLKADLFISTNFIILIALLSVLSSVLISYMFYHNDLNQLFQ